MILVFSKAITLLLALSHVGFQALSGARAYVHGESQWAKAQKQSVISLLEFALEGNETSYPGHLEALEVIYGDRLARQTLDSTNPDFDVARQGFLDGRNLPGFLYSRPAPLEELTAKPESASARLTRQNQCRRPGFARP